MKTKKIMRKTEENSGIRLEIRRIGAIRVKERRLIKEEIKGDESSSVSGQR